MNQSDLEQFIERYGDDILSFCLYLTKDRAEAEDLCQDTFISAFGKMDRIQADANVKSYFLAIAVGLWKNRRRKFAWRLRIFTERFRPEPGDPLNTPEQSAAKAQVQEWVQACVQKLPEKQRLVVLLYYMEGLKEPDIAAVLGIPVGTVKSRLHQAKASLKEMLADQMDED